MADNKGEIIMYQPNETIRLEVRMGEETVWLTQQQMAELFDKDRTVIGRHIRNIYREEELEQNITCAKFAHMGSDGDQEYEYTAYNLDVIISVGYRVKSKRGTKFRQWANKVLKEYLLRGYVVNTRIAALEYSPVTINICQHNHDRFLIIDEDVYVFGASLKDAGKRLFAYIRMQETNAQMLLSGIR